MKSITLKIFLSYWLVAVIVNIISDNIVARHQMRRPRFVRTALRSMMVMSARREIAQFESKGCSATGKDRSVNGDQLYLADATGKPFCGSINVDLQGVAARVRGTENLVAKRFGEYQIVASWMKGDSGKEYTFFLKNHYTSSLAWIDWMIPGPTTLAASGAITLVFAFLLTRPIRRLRAAARQIALGDLDARVSTRRTVGSIEDDLAGLTRDFNHMAERLKNLVQAQHLLLRDVSHELRSPLARMNVALELTRREANSSTIVHLDRIEREVNRLNELISQLLSLSYMETTGEIHDARTVSLRSLVRDVLSDVQYEASLRGCQIVATMQNECLVEGNERLLGSALENVLRNAVRFTPENGNIELNITQIVSGREKLAELRVCDEGPGVPDGELDAILRPFYRVDCSRQTKTGGFGVGLAIADRAIRLHGGTIIASNRPNGGLIISMRLPVCIANDCVS